MWRQSNKCIYAYNSVVKRNIRMKMFPLGVELNFNNHRQSNFVSIISRSWDIKRFASSMCFFVPLQNTKVQKCFGAVITRRFSPVCVPLDLFRLIFSENVLRHWSHEKGFSPVCVLLYLFGLLEFRNVLGQ